MSTNKIIKRIFGLFFQGILYITPIFIPLYIMYSLFISLDTQFKLVFGFEVPGLGVLLMFVLLTFIGWIGKFLITQPIKKQFTLLLDKAPLLKLIYNSVQDLLKAFVGKEKKFTKPVLVKVNPMTNLEKIGFITQEDLTEFDIYDGKMAVYFPHSYAFSGELYIVPKEQITLLDKKSADVMKFIVSAGISMS